MNKSNQKLPDTRHQARRILIQALFAYSFFNKPPLVNFINQFVNEFSQSKYDKKLVQTVEKSIVESLSKIDSIIAQAASDWPLEQIAKIDLAILRLAVFEMVIIQSVPYKVAINEAIELAKEFSGEVSAKFVNGALGAIVKNSKLL